jgi:hypothetical protein
LISNDEEIKGTQLYGDWCDIATTLRMPISSFPEGSLIREVEIHDAGLLGERHKNNALGSNAT